MQINETFSPSQPNLRSRLTIFFHALAFVIGLLIVWQVFRTSRKPVDSPAVTDQPLAAGEDSEVMRRIEQDLQHREKES